MTFQQDVDNQAPTAASSVRLKRGLVDQAIAHASAAEWAEAAETNRKIIEMGPDAEAENRLAKAHWELGELANAREHYQTALALDPTNRIAERNIDRLRVLLVDAGEKTVKAQDGSKAPVSIFVEETGKTGFAFLTDLPDPRKLAQVNPGDAVELTPEGNRLIATSNGMRIGVVEPRVAARLLKLMADGNKYLGRRHLARRQGRPDHHPRGLPGPAQLRQGELPDRGQVDRPAALHEGHPRARGDGPRRGPRGRRRGRGDRGSRPGAAGRRTTDEAFVEEPDELDEG